MNTPTPAVLSTLIAARQLIELPENWASDETKITDACFCIVTAIAAVPADGAVICAACDLMDDVCGGDAIIFSDTHSHKQVLAAFDRGISGGKRSGVGR